MTACQFLQKMFDFACGLVRSLMFPLSILGACTTYGALSDDPLRQRAQDYVCGYDAARGDMGKGYYHGQGPLYSNCDELWETAELKYHFKEHLREGAGD